MRLLRQTIRQLIKESVYSTDFSKIDWMIAKLGTHGYPTEVVIDHKDQSGHDLVIKINELKPSVIRGRKRKGSRMAVLQIDKAEKNCLNAYEVSWAYSPKKFRWLGIGPLMYEVAMEYVTQEYGVGLSCDRLEVSEHARPVWEKFYERSKTDPEITTEPLDFDYGPEEKKFTPNYADDDCEEGTSVDWFLTLKEKDPWSNEGPTDEFKKWWKEEDPSSRVYKKSPARTILKLEEVGLLRINK